MIFPKSDASQTPWFHMTCALENAKQTFGLDEDTKFHTVCGIVTTPSVGVWGVEQSRSVILPNISTWTVYRQNTSWYHIHPYSYSIQTHLSLHCPYVFLIWWVGKGKYALQLHRATSVSCLTCCRKRRISSCKRSDWMEPNMLHRSQKPGFLEGTNLR